MANNSLVLSSLDFDTLKQNLKSYLQNQTVFRDYDFSGSNMDVLLSLLSYNSYLNSFYLNMAAAESFLDTAQLKNSVISHSKVLNYVPQSYKSPEAVVSLTAQTTGIGSILTIPYGTQFSGTNANGSYVYVTDRTYTFNSSNNLFVGSDIKIYEGAYFNESFVVDKTQESQRYIISSKTLDTDSLRVTVFPPGSTVSYNYSKTDTLYNLNSQSNIFFIQAYNDQYELIFGDNVFGYSPENGSTVVATYRVTSGTDGGGIRSFICDNDIGAYNNGIATLTIETTTTASSGANAESIESIRFRAPRAFQTQNRAITTEDYKTLILNQFPEIKTLSAYGGETSDIVGVNFGKIIISPVTYSGSLLSNTKKQEIVNFIKDKMSVGLIPVVVDPSILYLLPNIEIKYDPRKTVSPANYIKQIATIAVRDYDVTFLRNFNTTFVESNFIDYMMQIEPGIISVNVSNTIKLNVLPEINRNQSFFVNFNNKLLPTNISSSTFLSSNGIRYKFTDYNPNVTRLITQKNSSGVSVLGSADNKLYLVSQEELNTTYIEIGKIDYERGIISTYDLNIASYEGSGIDIFAVPFNNDVQVIQNQLIEFDLGLTKINVSNI